MPIASSAAPQIMILLCFILGTLAAGLVLYLPFFVWFRFRGRRKTEWVSPELQLSLNRAAIQARNRRYESISVEQLLLALLDDVRVVGVLRGCSIDVKTMRGSLQEVVQQDTLVAEGTGGVEPEASLAFQRVLQRAIAHVMAVARPTGALGEGGAEATAAQAVLRRTAQRAADGSDALVAILDEPESRAAEVLRSHGVTRLAVTRMIAHGTPATESNAADETLSHGQRDLAVVLENDDFTPMEFVVSMLQNHLGLDPAAATRAMLAIHNEGRTVCGRFPAEVAAAKVREIRTAASAAGHPLRCVTETM